MKISAALFVIMSAGLFLISGIVQHASATTVVDFAGPYELQNWSSSGILGGTTTIAPATGSATQATFSYDVDLGNPGGGVSLRTATFSTTSAGTGNVSFDFMYNFFHASFSVNADLIAFADGSSGTTQVVLLDFFNQNFTGPQSFSGSGIIPVEQGFDFGFVLGGSNFDSNSMLNGDLIITNFTAPSPIPVPAAIWLFGTALIGLVGFSKRRKLAWV